VDPELIRRYDKLGPRYTSYPTADRFVEAFGPSQYAGTLDARGFSGTRYPLSLYIHLPFCNTICYYCGCNKVITKDTSRSAKYLRYLEREFALVAEHLSGPRKVEQLHLGGGTPTFLSCDELRQLMKDLSKHYELLPGEYAIEIDPRTVDDEKIAVLGQLGFNRMSMGIQDFDPAVQQAVNRLQSEEQTAATIASARRNGVTSINVDLIYGLPKQNLAGFGLTLDKVIAIQPDRIALYSYAHLPTMFKPQRRINELELPSAETKLEIMALAIRKLAAAGYVYIGMDHFALPHDELAVAAQQSRLHRNFQGYSTRPDSDLVAFGISAISKVGATYSQNVKTLDEYYDRIDTGELPILRGIELTPDDLVRRSVIQSLMCHFELSMQSIEIAHLIRFREYFDKEWPELLELERDGLIEIAGDWITVTPRGRLLVRIIAMVFDRYLRQGEARARFSKVI
jgi:oxygen-independent coproporphyrinogen-3 oxidase